MQWDDPNSTYYFFSTGAQAIAAIAGLTSAMAVIRIQYFNQDCRQKVDEIEACIGNAYRWIRNENVSVISEYNTLTNGRDRIAWFWSRYLIDDQSAKSALKARFDAHYCPGGGTAEQKQKCVIEWENFQSLRLEYNDLKLQEGNKSTFISSVAKNIGFGFSVVFIGILFTTLPAVGLSSCLHATSKIGFGIATATYLVLSAKLARKALGT